MHPDTISMAVFQFKAKETNILKLVFNNKEFTFDNNVIIECYDTCMSIGTKLDDGKVHTLYVEYAMVMGVEVIEQS